MKARPDQTMLNSRWPQSWLKSIQPVVSSSQQQSWLNSVHPEVRLASSGGAEAAPDRRLPAAKTSLLPSTAAAAAASIRMSLDMVLPR